MTDDVRAGARREFEARHGIPPDRFCGLTAAEMSRAIVAHDAGPATAGGSVGYDPIATPDTRLGRLRAEFGPDADVEAIRLRIQCFGSRVAEALALDWMQDTAAFGRAVAAGLEAHYPELSAAARGVIGGSYTYSHGK